MGCTNSSKKHETDVVGHRQLNEGGIKNRFYATTEFDISASESENEDEILSIKSINNNNNMQNLTKKVNEISSGLPKINNNLSATTNTTLLDNRLNQTSV